MFCSNCGKQVPDGQRFCANCGASLAPKQEQPAQPQYQPPVYQQPAQPQYQPQYQQPAHPQYQPQYQQPAYQQPDTFQLGTAPTTQGISKPKKSKKGLFIGLGVGLAVVAAAAAVVLNFDAIKGLFGGEKALADRGTPQEQAEYLYGSVLNELTGALTADPAETSEDFRVDGTLGIHLNSDITDMLEAQLGMDMDWAKDYTLTYTAQQKGDLAQALMGVGIGDTTQLTLEAIAQGQEMVWLGLPGLNKDYLEIDIEALAESGMAIMAPSSSQYMLEMLPDDETLAKSLEGYTGIVLSYLEDAESSTETVKCNGLKQELTVLRVKLTEKQLAQMCKELLQYAAKDKSVKIFLNNYTDYTRKQYLDYGFTQEEINQYFPDMYAEFQDSLDELLAEMDDIIANAQKGNYLYIYNYVDVADVVGMKVEIHDVEDETREVSFLTVWENDEFAFLADFEDLQITGEGVREKGIVEGEYVVEMEGEEVLILEVEDYDQDAAEDGKLIGTFTLRPAPGIANVGSSSVPSDGTAASAAGSVISMMAVRVKLDCSEEKIAGSVELLAAGSNFVTVDFAFTEGEAGKIKVPTDTIVFEGGQQALADWIQDMDFDSLLDALEDAGMPKDLIDALENSLNQNLPVYDTPAMAS